MTFGVRSLTWFIASVASAAAVFSALHGCSSIAKSVIQEPKVTLAHVSVQKVDLTGATIGVGVQVENPNPFKLRLDSLKYKLEVGGKQITESELPDIAEVGGHSTQVIEIPVPVKFQDIYNSALDFLQKTTSHYHITGEARFGLLTIPFDHSGDMKLR
jgi:LEA14-like dessication related protein